MSPGVSLRLTLCLVMLHGWGGAVSEEAGGGFVESDSGEVLLVPDMAGLSPGVEGGGIVAGRENGNAEGKDGNVAMAAERDGGTAVPAAGDAHEAVDATGAASAPVGECDGKRFKKCR